MLKQITNFKLKRKTMNKTKIAGVLLAALLLFLFEKTNAQTQTGNNNQQQSSIQTDTQDADTSSDVASEPVEGYQERVTIAGSENRSSSTGNNSGSTEGRTESTTKIHIYSGKHDGNNVINPDPKH